MSWTASAVSTFWSRPTSTAQVRCGSIPLKPEERRANYPVGINFPSYAFENQAETEGFAKMAKRAGYGVYGLPNYVVWHIDTDEKPGNLGGRKAY